MKKLFYFLSLIILASCGNAMYGMKRSFEQSKKPITYYEILSVPQNASQDDITNAYRKLALVHHPDKNIDNQKEAEEKFKPIVTAYEILKDEVKKLNYDNYLSSEQIYRTNLPFNPKGYYTAPPMPYASNPPTGNSTYSSGFNTNNQGSYNPSGWSQKKCFNAPCQNIIERKEWAAYSPCCFKQKIGLCSSCLDNCRTSSKTQCPIECPDCHKNIVKDGATFKVIKKTGNSSYTSGFNNQGSSTPFGSTNNNFPKSYNPSSAKPAEKKYVELKKCSHVSCTNQIPNNTRRFCSPCRCPMQEISLCETCMTKSQVQCPGCYKNMNIERKYGMISLKSNVPLHDACKLGQFDTVKSLLERGAEVNFLDEESFMPLHYACEISNHNIAQLLLKYGANVSGAMRNLSNEKWKTPLHNACDKGHFTIVQLLLDHGAGIDITRLNCNYYTPLQLAEQHTPRTVSFEAIIKLLNRWLAKK